MVSEPATTLDLKNGPQEWAKMIVLQEYHRKKLRHSLLFSSFAEQFTEGGKCQASNTGPYCGTHFSSQ